MLLVCDIDQAQHCTQSMSTTMLPPAKIPAASSPADAAKATVAQNQQDPLRCPRCDSANTKFCYYNNYSLSQPRHFCKACKRYWTRGGTLRNVPVGGGCRKNKRAKKQHHQQKQANAAAAAAAAASTMAGPATTVAAASAQSDLASFLYAAGYDPLGLGGLIPTSDQLPAANLVDLQPPASYLNIDYSAALVSSLKQPKKVEDFGDSLLPYDAANLGFFKDFSESNNWMSNNTEWGFQFPPASNDSFLYWNPAVVGANGWPDAANSSVAPLI